MLEPVGILHWDYLAWVKHEHSSFVEQWDWTQTLVTVINQASSMLVKVEPQIGTGANTVLANPEIFSVFNQMLYYNSETHMIGDRYLVVYDPEHPKGIITVARVEDNLITKAVAIQITNIKL